MPSLSEIWQRVAGWPAKAASAARSLIRLASDGVSALVSGRQGRQSRPAPSPPSGIVPPLSGPAPAATPDRQPLGEDDVIYAIGDIHGRADLLEQLIQIIEADADRHGKPATLVFLGDYVDRGFQSKQVIDTLIGDRLAGFDVHCLKGNHEEAMLTFVSDPDFGPRWSAYGGRETLVSYGVRPPRSQTRMDEWLIAHEHFVTVFPKEHELFLMQLRSSVQLGPYGFVHAGVRPGIPFAQQEDKDLLWIRDEFLNSPSAHEFVIVHGHTPVSAPFRDDRRINVDTGAYFSGRLTAARLDRETVDFLSTKT